MPKSWRLQQSTDFRMFFWKMPWLFVGHVPAIDCLSIEAVMTVKTLWLSIKVNPAAEVLLMTACRPRISVYRIAAVYLLVQKSCIIARWNHNWGYNGEMELVPFTETLNSLAQPLIYPVTWSPFKCSSQIQDKTRQNNTSEAVGARFANDILHK